MNQERRERHEKEEMIEEKILFKDECYEMFPSSSPISYLVPFVSFVVRNEITLWDGCERFIRR